MNLTVLGLFIKFMSCVVSSLVNLCKFRYFQFLYLVVVVFGKHTRWAEVMHVSFVQCYWLLPAWRKNTTAIFYYVYE